MKEAHVYVEKICFRFPPHHRLDVDYLHIYNNKQPYLNVIITHYNKSSMKTRHTCCLFSIIFLFSSCTKELPYSGNDFNVPVCNAFISPDQALTIHLSYSANITGAVATMDGASIDVYENGELLPIAFVENNGFYKSDFFPQAGNIYSIDVWKDGIKLLTACDTLPEKVIIVDSAWQFPVGMMDTSTDAGLVTFSFVEDPLRKNYYEIMLCSYGRGNELYFNYLMEINNEFISLNTDHSWLDIRSFLFSDSLIQGKTVDIQIRTQGSISSQPIVILRNVSRSYYQYRQRLPVHQFLQVRKRDENISFFRGEPIDMFANVNGGLGVFVAYYQDIKECRVIQ
jgi:hypothetical protein